MSRNNTTMDIEKVEIVSYMYKQDWHRMSLYDQDRDNIEWHVANCMNYIVMRSEDVLTQWNAPPDLELDESWTEEELLALYHELLEPANQAGYKTDQGVMTRIRKIFGAIVKNAGF